MITINHRIMSNSQFARPSHKIAPAYFISHVECFLILQTYQILSISGTYTQVPCLKCCFFPSSHLANSTSPLVLCLSVPFSLSERLGLEPSRCFLDVTILVKVSLHFFLFFSFVRKTMALQGQILHLFYSRLCCWCLSQYL